MRQNHFLFSTILIIWGCSSPIIEGTNEDSLNASVEKIRKSLPAETLTEFDAAIALLLKERSRTRGDATGSRAEMLMEFRGRTAESILAQAGDLREIQELEAKEFEWETAKIAIGRFEVLSSKFYREDNGIFGDKPVMEMIVRNGTGKAISLVQFDATLKSPERSVPWHTGSFSYRISGGLEPGETATWSLVPSSILSEWADVRAPHGAEFIVTITELVGTDGKALFSEVEFNEIDSLGLELRRSRYQRLYGRAFYPPVTGNDE